MPLHDWTRVDTGIYHVLHMAWISAIQRKLIEILPDEYYPLITQASTITEMSKESSTEFYLRKQNTVVIHHVSGDRVVAMIEIVSPGNKNSASGIRAFIQKAREMLEQKVHLLILDPFPTNVRNPNGLHAEIFSDWQDNPLELPADKRLSLFAYECADCIRAYLEPIAVGDTLPDMPIFLRPDFYINVPLEETYLSAWDAVPKRWQKVIAT